MSAVPAQASATGTSQSRRSLLGFGAVTLVAAAHAAHDLFDGQGVWRAVLASAVIVAQCAVLSAGHAWLSRWRAPRWATLAVGAVASAAFGVLVVLVHAQSAWREPGAIAVGGIVGLAITGLWVLLFRLPATLERARLRALETESLRREAELVRLRVHLHPHFLLNTLNDVAGLLGEDPEEARRLLAALGDLVRDALASGDEPRPFAEDLAWLRRYAEVLEMRHRGRLAFRWEIPPATLEVPVPRLLLQPLVENAAQHGVLRRREGGTVRIAAEAAGGGVRFVVEDDGPGMGPEVREGLGIGLVRRRLALTRPEGMLVLASSERGTRAVVELPSAEEGRR
ncbi:MAG: histidine kinase [Deltaproteobacteria bacterium]|nr:histidine kinase [Deltaproteobacteria bacterium]